MRKKLALSLAFLLILIYTEVFRPRRHRRRPLICAAVRRRFALGVGRRARGGRPRRCWWPMPRPVAS